MYCSDKTCYNVDCPLRLDVATETFSDMHGLEIELVDLRHTEECEGYKSLDDIVQAIKKKFPDWYWAEED